MEKNTTFMRQTGTDSPTPSQQSTGLFVSRCGESGLFESRHSVKNKKLFHQTVKELFVVGVTGLTHGLLVPNQARYQLRYTPKKNPQQLCCCGGWG